MTPQALAALHARAAASAWSADSFATLLAEPSVFLSACTSAFSLGRQVLDEAELLLIATDPDAQRKGLGRKMLQEFEAAAKTRGAERAFLEVAANNSAARALYDVSGWSQEGLRRNYYRNADGSRTDAILMVKLL